MSQLKINPLIEKELNEIKVANVPEIDSYEFVISKGTRSVSEIVFEKGKYYCIELKDYIIHPYEGFNLHVQWNNNIPPKDIVMNVEVLDIMGKMIKVTGTGSSGIVWTGWLPISSITILNIL